MKAELHRYQGMNTELHKRVRITDGGDRGKIVGSATIIRDGRISALAVVELDEGFYKDSENETNYISLLLVHPDNLEDED